MLVLIEVFTNGLSYYILTIISALSVLCGLFVITNKNPIVSILFLIGLFINISLYLMMLGINFIGISYLLVYVGAVSILFLFILMLINVRVSELVTDNYNSIPLGIVTGVIYSIVLFKLLPSNYSGILDNIFSEDNLLYVTSQVWDGALSEISHITNIGNIMYTVYPLWLIITSLILLLAMVGAIVITIK